MTPTLTFLLMSLAAYGITRLVTADSFTDWFREGVQLRADEQPDGRFWIRMAQFVECGWCLGAWTSFAVVAWTAQYTNVPLPLLQAWAVRCAVGMLGSRFDD